MLHNIVKVMIVVAGLFVKEGKSLKRTKKSLNSCGDCGHIII